jgi:hypothetical protein
MGWGTVGGSIEKGWRLLKNAHLRRFPQPSSFDVRSQYDSRLRLSGALHLGIFEQPEMEVEAVESDSERAPQRGARERMKNRRLPWGSQISEARCEDLPKRPSAAFPSAFVVRRTFAVRLTPQAFGSLAPGHF